MSMLILTAAISFAVQMTVLLAPVRPVRCLRGPVTALLVGFPLAGAAWYAAARPWLWDFSAAMCLWMAGAAAVGCALAWAIWAGLGKRRKDRPPKGGR